METDEEVRIISMRKATRSARDSAFKVSRTAFRRVRAMKHKDSDLSEAPEITTEQIPARESDSI